MKIPYFSLLNNCPIQINNIGSFKSPQLKELFDSKKGFVNYGFASTIFGTTKNEMIEQFKKIQIEIPKEILELSKFQILISNDFLIQLFQNALSYFLVENIKFENNLKVFGVYNGNDFNAENIIGYIGEDNFDIVENIIQQLMGQKIEDDKPEKFASELARKAWEMRKEYEKDLKKNSAEGFDLGTMISKLCVAGIGYTFFNIYDLTVYQLYDAFSSYANMRIANLCDNAYAHNGGENHDVMLWAKGNN